MMSNRKLFFIAGLLLAALTGLRFVWLSFQLPPEHPLAAQGVLDLRDWEFENQRSIALNGEWEFYPGRFLEQNDAEAFSLPSQSYVKVPGDWRSSVSDKGDSSYGYGTYRLRILTGGRLNQPYGFWIRNIQTSSMLFMNGQLLAKFGSPAEQAENYKPKANSYTVSYIAGEQREIEIIVHATNFDNPLKGGIVQSIRFGSQAAIDTEWMYSIGFQLVTFIILLLHGLYAGIMYVFNRRQQVFSCLFLLLVCSALSVAADDSTLLLIWLPINYTWAVKIKWLAYLGISLFMLKLTTSLIPEHEINKSFRWFYVPLGLYTAFIFFSPVQYVIYSGWLFLFFYLFPVLAVLYVIGKMLLKNYIDIVFLLMAAVSLTSSIIWGIVQTFNWVDMTFYPWDIFAGIIGFSAFWFKRYYRHAEQNAKLTARLLRADKLKDEFLANTSHELRTPLHGIINIAHTIAANERHSMNEKSRKDFELLITISRRMSQMLNDLLDLSRLNEKRIVLQPADLRVQSVASGVVDMLGFMTEGKPIRFSMDIPESFPHVMADEKRLVQILFNLLHNAVKFTEEGTISISAETKGGRAVIHVSDTGIGMDEDTQSRVFQPYEQGMPGIGTGGGIGLGLSICKQLVELHGGKLTVRSTPGEGSEFTFTLPLSNESLRREEAAAMVPELDDSDEVLVLHNAATPELWSVLPDTSQSTATDTMKILAVDDDPVNLKVLCNILSTEQYDIGTAVSGREAVGMLDAEQWDLIIADVMMPHMSGYELARIVRERFSIAELPILLLTARNQPEDVYSGFLSGANDYVTKPVDALELKYRVRALATLKQSVSERLRIEAAYLQAQIQPHFLFNTLNSIMALSTIDTDKMQKLVEAFSSFLRISFDFWNSEQLVPLEHELELVRSYLYIEKERFEDRLHIVWEVELDIRLQLPPLTIQPLVENAVKHGILSQRKGGTVRIHITDDSNCWAFTISDDGAGMDEEKVRNLLDSTQRSDRGIGLLNTDRRLKQLYGKGLSIASKPGEGTSISFIIPKPGKDPLFLQ
ncbi:ATP-binding protein [Paenibacillus profundus]|uniref:histidine kinase n=1 Tax=Paenibacillus profundus TaxID=1173085 RepID=A0ABS8YRR1_9BACL|nr:ATP-binding protein [Paenibacillus profundus]MCE5173305.1 ATP-binding protein [Paenibacillus profundus]